MIPSDEEFLALLLVYMERRASREEEAEFIRLVKTGKYDHLIKEYLDECLLEEGDSDMHGGDAAIIQSKILISAARNHRDINGREVKMSLLPPTKKSTLFSRWWQLAAAAVIIALTGWWIGPQQAVTDTGQTAVVEPATYAGKDFIRLPDGSKVLLNEGSRLSYTADFGRAAREVVLTGEAYFDVSHDYDRPFRVLTGRVTTTVLGTAFNVKAYPDQEEVLVTVERGRVEVADDQQVFGTLTENQQIAVNVRTGTFVLQKEIKAEEAIEWKKNYLILDDVSMQEAASVLEQKYQVKVVAIPDDLKDCRLSATFLDGENLEQVLDVITGVMNASYKMEKDGTIRITGGRGC